MRMKNDNVLMHLRNFGFTMEENNAEGFMRWQKVIGNMIVTVANGQFENKIRVSLLQDKDGHIKTTYHDILAYTRLICSMQEAGIIKESAEEQSDDYSEFGIMDNPLESFPRKPEGFMTL